MSYTTDARVRARLGNVGTSTTTLPSASVTQFIDDADAFITQYTGTTFSFTPDSATGKNVLVRKCSTALAALASVGALKGANLGAGGSYTIGQFSVNNASLLGEYSAFAAELEKEAYECLKLLGRGGLVMAQTFT